MERMFILFSLLVRFDGVSFSSFFLILYIFFKRFHQLLRTHTLRRVALFDQFAYTPHIETGVWLQIKK